MFKDEQSKCDEVHEYLTEEELKSKGDLLQSVGVRTELLYITEGKYAGKFCLSYKAIEKEYCEARKLLGIEYSCVELTRHGVLIKIPISKEDRVMEWLYQKMLKENAEQGKE